VEIRYRRCCRGHAGGGEEIVYALDSSGTAYAIRRDGTQLWRSRVEVPTSLGPKITDSPLVTKGTVIFGDQAGFVHGLDAQTGAARWRIRPNPHPAASIFASAALAGDKVLIGTASVEEMFAALPGYRCCTFRGLHPGPRR
jgi:polyvinyl alcohol dehydrogenase (cytochrome)